MPRLVSTQGVRSDVRRAELNAAEAPTPQQRAEDYLERVAKFVPVEIVAAFLAIRGLLAPFGSPDAVPPWVEFTLYGFLVVVTPIYLLKFGGAVPKKGLQATVATVSFLIWSYGIGGPFFFKTLEHGLNVRVEYHGLGGALVAAWSLLIPVLFKPSA